MPLGENLPKPGQFNESNINPVVDLEAQWREKLGLPTEISSTYLNFRPENINQQLLEISIPPDSIGIADGSQSPYSGLTRRGFVDAAVGYALLQGGKKLFDQLGKIASSPNQPIAPPDNNIHQGTDHNGNPIIVTRRDFIKGAAAVAAGAAALGLTACATPEPTGAPATRLPEQPQQPVIPTPTIQAENKIIDAVKKADTSKLSEQDKLKVWARTNFAPQMKALKEQFPAERIQNMVMKVGEVEKDSDSNTGYIFEVSEKGNENLTKYFYFGADKDGKDGKFVALPINSTVLKDGSGLNIANAVDAKGTMFQYKYDDSFGNYSDVRSGMMTGNGAVAKGITKDAIDAYVGRVAPTTSALVKAEVTKGGSSPEFLMKAMSDSGGKLFSIIEEATSDGRTKVYAVSERSNGQVQIHQLNEVSGYRYMVDRKTGEIGLYKESELAGKVIKLDVETGNVEVDIPGVSTPTSTPSPTLPPTATVTPTAIVTIEPSATPTAPPTATVKPPPTETARPTPEILPLPFAGVKSIDLNNIPPELFGKSNISRQVGNYIFSNSGVIGQNTLLEKMSSYPGFEGVVVHVDVESPSPIDSMQRPYIANESTQATTGSWAAEVSKLILKTPSFLKNSGYHRDPILSLTSVGWHPDNNKTVFRMVGGVRLLTNDGINYSVMVYRVNLDGSVTDTITKVPFKVKEKQIIRTELFYKGDVKYFRAFLRDADPENKYVFIGEIQLDPNIKEPIQGDITWSGLYPGRDVVGVEGISGEVKIFR